MKFRRRRKLVSLFLGAAVLGTCIHRPVLAQEAESGDTSQNAVLNFWQNTLLDQEQENVQTGSDFPDDLSALLDMTAAGEASLSKRGRMLSEEDAHQGIVNIRLQAAGKINRESVPVDLMFILDQSGSMNSLTRSAQSPAYLSPCLNPEHFYIVEDFDWNMTGVRTAFRMADFNDEGPSLAEFTGRDARGMYIQQWMADLLDCIEEQSSAYKTWKKEHGDSQTESALEQKQENISLLSCPELPEAEGTSSDDQNLSSPAISHISKIMQETTEAAGIVKNEETDLPLDGMEKTDAEPDNEQPDQNSQNPASDQQEQISEQPVPETDFTVIDGCLIIQNTKQTSRENLYNRVYDTSYPYLLKIIGDWYLLGNHYCLEDGKFVEIPKSTYPEQMLAGAVPSVQTNSYSPVAETGCYDRAVRSKQYLSEYLELLAQTNPESRIGFALFHDDCPPEYQFPFSADQSRNSSVLSYTNGGNQTNYQAAFEAALKMVQEQRSADAAQAQKQGETYTPRPLYTVFITDGLPNMSLAGADTDAGSYENIHQKKGAEAARKYQQEAGPMFVIGLSTDTSYLSSLAAQPGMTYDCRNMEDFHQVLQNIYEQTSEGYPQKGILSDTISDDFELLIDEKHPFFAGNTAYMQADQLPASVHIDGQQISWEAGRLTEEGCSMSFFVRAKDTCFTPQTRVRSFPTNAGCYLRYVSSGKIPGTDPEMQTTPEAYFSRLKAAGSDGVVREVDGPALSVSTAQVTARKAHSLGTDVTVRPDDTFVYSITVKNLGTLDLKDLFIDDLLDERLSFAGMVPDTADTTSKIEQNENSEKQDEQNQPDSLDPNKDGSEAQEEQSKMMPPDLTETEVVQGNSRRTRLIWYFNGFRHNSTQTLHFQVKVRPDAQKGILPNTASIFTDPDEPGRKTNTVEVQIESEDKKKDPEDPGSEDPGSDTPDPENPEHPKKPDITEEVPISGSRAPEKATVTSVPTAGTTAPLQNTSSSRTSSTTRYASPVATAIRQNPHLFIIGTFAAAVAVTGLIVIRRRKF